MYLAIIILPLLGSIASGFFGRKIGFSGSHIITCTAVIMTTVLAVIAFFEVGLNNVPVSIELFRWIDSESLYVSWTFNFDSLTVSMLIPVLVVSSLVHVYSIGYMSHDPHNQRFFSYLSLFTVMMLILITANNFLLMFVGWEGVGVCSYLLVCFWHSRIAANQSSLSAFLTNRVGDCFLTIGMFAMIRAFGNLDYTTVFSLAPFMNENVVTLIGICLVTGAMAKSSQVGLHVWLPMAMEGPTPVSALIHAATMVTAGVYLLMRSSPLIEYSSIVLMLCLWLGAITTVFSSLIGLFQQDIKKVIAYSTMSQLGMMVIAVGLSCYGIALFHLVNHAFYKALLFLGAGAVIHAVADNQDFRRYGGLRPFLPLTYSVMLIASLSLVAFPFMTGFYSKDFILESAYGQFYFSGTVVYIIATIGAMFTTLYSVKVLYLTFLTNPNGPLINYKNAHEGDIFMSSPLMILAVFSIFFGFVTKDMFIGLGSGFFSDNALFIHPSHEIMLDTEFGVATLFKLLPLLFTISLSVIAILLSEFLSTILISFKLSRAGYNIFSFFNQRFLIESFYNRYITGIVLKLGGQTTKVIDKGSVEYIGPHGLEKGLLNISNNIANLNTGSITTYALYITISMVFYMLFSSYIGISILILSILLATSLVLHNTGNPFSSKNSCNGGIWAFVFIFLLVMAYIMYLECLDISYLGDGWAEFSLLPSVEFPNEAGYTNQDLKRKREDGDSGDESSDSSDESSDSSEAVTPNTGRRGDLASVDRYQNCPGAATEDTETNAASSTTSTNASCTGDPVDTSNGSDKSSVDPSPATNPHSFTEWMPSGIFEWFSSPSASAESSSEPEDTQPSTPQDNVALTTARPSTPQNNVRSTTAEASTPPLVDCNRCGETADPTEEPGVSCSICGRSWCSECLEIIKDIIETLH